MKFSPFRDFFSVKRKQTRDWHWDWEANKTVAFAYKQTKPEFTTSARHRLRRKQQQQNLHTTTTESAYNNSNHSHSGYCSAQQRRHRTKSAFLSNPITAARAGVLRRHDVFVFTSLDACRKRIGPQMPKWTETALASSENTFFRTTRQKLEATNNLSAN